MGGIMTNPYADPPQEADWDAGFRAGLVVPDQTITAPLGLSPEARDAYESGTDDNLELFMAVADPTGSAGSGDDPLGANGVWHGLFRLTFIEAQENALTYDDPTKAYIHRYQTSQPTVVDVLRP